MLLAMDTSTSLIGAACLSGQTVLGEATVADPRRHGELLAPTIERALADSGQGLSQVSEVVTGVGPGPFTGLRVGITTALVMARALGVPVLGICSLDALADQARTWMSRHGHPLPAQLLVATDARRKEVYWARYELDDTGVERTGEPAVGRAAELPEAVRHLPAVGRGAWLYSDVLHPLTVDDEPEPSLLDVHPGQLGRLAGLPGHVLAPEPLYLRRPDAQPQPQTRPPAAMAAGSAPPPV
jgi:tRNA threonylcarbamoyl adenosine modification protein YeaZ